MCSHILVITSKDEERRHFQSLKSPQTLVIATCAVLVAALALKLNLPKSPNLAWSPGVQNIRVHLGGSLNEGPFWGPFYKSALL